jgi:hypothetical protein
MDRRVVGSGEEARLEVFSANWMVLSWGADSGSEDRVVVRSGEGEKLLEKLSANW